MRRGEIWWAILAPPRGIRPVVLLTRDEALSFRTHVTVAPLTRSGRDIGSFVRVGPAEGVREESAINADDIETISISDLDRRITTLSPERMAEVDFAIKFALALT